MLIYEQNKEDLIEDRELVDWLRLCVVGSDKMDVKLVDSLGRMERSSGVLSCLSVQTYALDNRLRVIDVGHVK